MFLSRYLFRLYSLGMLLLFWAIVTIPLHFVFGEKFPLGFFCLMSTIQLVTLHWLRRRHELTDVRTAAEPHLRLQRGERVVRAVSIPERRDWLFTIKAADGTPRQVAAQAHLRAVLPSVCLGWVMSIALVSLVSWGLSSLLFQMGFPWDNDADVFGVLFTFLIVFLLAFPCHFLLTRRFRSTRVRVPSNLSGRFVEVVGYVATDEEDTAFPEFPSARTTEERGYRFYYLSDPESPRRPGIRELKARPIARRKVNECLSN